MYRTILADVPWKYEVPPKRQDSRKGRKPRECETMYPPYPMMELQEIKELPIPDLADSDCHLWFWTTNRYLPDSFDLLKHWGFKFFHLVTWVKPSGFGMWFVHRTQPLLFAYRGKLQLARRCNPDVIFDTAKRHSQKPLEVYDLIEAASHKNYLEMFSRCNRQGWDVFGNECEGSIRLPTQRVPDAWESTPLQAFSHPETLATSQALSTPPTRG
jgi:N6-adenosine-specific RNA methylase IME4